MKPSLDGVRAKIARATEHFEELKFVLSEHDSTNPTKLSLTQLKPERKAIVARVEHVPEVPLKVRIIIGEVVHALASALDNIVFQLSLSHQLAIGNPTAFETCDSGMTAFPIFAEANNRIDKLLSLMAPEPAALIRDMQPYKAWPDAATRSPLWALYHIDRIDKHRVVLAVAHSVAPTEISITTSGKNPDPVLAIKDAPWQRLEPGAELFRIDVLSGDLPDPDTRFNVVAGRRILFAQTGDLDGDNILHVLKELIPFVETQVIDVLAQYVK